MRFFIKCFLLILSGVSVAPLLAQEATASLQQQSSEIFAADSWNRYVRGFRRSHHFAVSTGYMQNRWRLKNFSAQAGDEDGGAGIIKLKYSFHIPWYAKTGFFLGTSMGARLEADDDSASYASKVGFHYPGLLAGIVYNHNSRTRIWASYERYLERFEQLEIRYPDVSTAIGSTLTVNDLAIGFDYFYSLRWALSFEFHYNYAVHNNPESKDGENTLLTTEFERQGYWAGLGIIFHHL